MSQERGVLVQSGLSDWATALFADWTGHLFAGLYANDREPDRTSTLADFTEATFSGYARVYLSGFAIDSWDGIRLLTKADPVAFFHNGGPVGENIFGLFVADDRTGLQYAVRFSTAPIVLYRPTDALTYSPFVALQSLFP